MATKWRNKALFVLYALLLVIGLSGPLTFMEKGSLYLYRDYYRTPQFQEQLDHFASYLNLFELNGFTKPEAKSSLTVEENEIAEYRGRIGTVKEQLNSIRDKYESSIEEAIADNNALLTDYYTDLRDREQENLMKQYRNDDDLKNLIRKEKERRIDSYFAQRELYRPEFYRIQDHFDYYFQNDAAGLVHTNLGVRDEEAARNLLFDSTHDYATKYSADTSRSEHYYIEGSELLNASIIPYQGWIAVPKDSPVHKEAEQYGRNRLTLFAYGLLSTALLVVCLIRYRAGLSLRAEGSQWTAYRRLPVDAKLLILAATAVLTIVMLESLASLFPFIMAAPLFHIGKLLAALAVATLCMTLTLLQWRCFASWSDIRQQWPDSLWKSGSRRAKAHFDKTVDQVKDTFIYKSTGVRLLLLAFLLSGLSFIGGWTALSFLQSNDLSFLVCAPILLILWIVALLRSARQFSCLNRAAKAADELVAGHMPMELPQAGSGVLASLTSSINALRQGMKTLQNEQAKSERMKTELITNVSHDLRTPLTSIITYVGLLKSEDSSREERTAYVEIIDQKSKRLKTMIDDLFEVSTMASGNTKLILEETDLVQLMQQALGEYKEAMDSSDIQFRISLLEGPIYALADGQKLWRAFDNLIGNMLKYSLGQTRAYIDMLRIEQHKVMISFKNVSKYENSNNAEELFERFKRGDASRHTEGSGLGLAIVKSIIDLHGGRLTLETDGDLFKATVVLTL